MAAGFIPIFLIERISHHNPRFPIQNHRWVADLTVIGLSIHALADGFNLAIASKNETLGLGLAIVILVHHLPIAFVLTLAFLGDNSLIATIGRGLPFGSRLQLSLRLAFISTVGRLLPLAIAPVVGALIGERILTGRFGEFIGYLTAFAAGTLLNVVIESFHGGHASHAHAPHSEEEHSHSEEEHSHEVPSIRERILSLDKVTGAMAFAVGLLTVFLLTRDATHEHHGIHQHHGHQHEDHHHDEDH
jgi:zinc transporter ZupT